MKNIDFLSPEEQADILAEYKKIKSEQKPRREKMPIAISASDRRAVNREFKKLGGEINVVENLKADVSKRLEFLQHVKSQKEFTVFTEDWGTFLDFWIDEIEKNLEGLRTQGNKTRKQIQLMNNTLRVLENFSPTPPL